MKSVVVSGATRGLGLAISRLLLGERYAVIGLSRKPSAAFSSLMAQYSGHAFHYSVDISDATETTTVARALTKSHDSIYGLINNAAIAGDGALANMHASEIEQVLRTNLLGPMTLTKYIMRSMLLKGEGRIVNLSSTAAVTGYSGLSVYSATKAGLEGFTRSLSREAGRRQITVNCISPGYIPTEMSSGLKDDKLAAVKRRAPLGLASPEDVAKAVLFLLSDGGAKISGTVIRVDGGGAA